MSLKWTILFYLICAIMNYVHIYQICEEYLRYDTTTNVGIASPEKIEFPSFTLCVDIPAILKWNQMSPVLLSRLFVRGDRPRREFQPDFNESKAQEIINNSSLIPSALHDLPGVHNLIAMRYLYNEVVKEMTIPELLNMTYSFEKVFHAFSLNGLFVKPNGSTRFYMFMSNMSNFQFSIDKIFLHEGQKCFTLNLQSDLHSIIDFFDIQFLEPEDRHIIYWQTQSKQQTAFFLHKMGYLVSLKDMYFLLNFTSRGAISYKTFESIRLEYPYKTNCRHYTKVGLSSRKECTEKCFKNKTITKFGYVFSESHAFSFDDLHVGIQGDTNNTQDIFQECRRHCKEIECYSLKHSTRVAQTRERKLLLRKGCSKLRGSTCIDEKVDFEKQSSLFLFVSPEPFTRTESQPAISLITFLTAVFSTFGFWLGLSVSDFFHVATKICQKVQIIRDKIRSRERVAQRLTANQQRLKLLRQFNLERQLNLCLRRRLNTHLQLFRQI